MLVLSVDPGLSGAIAFLGDGWCRVLDLPTTQMEGEGTIRRRVHGPSLQQLLLANIPEGETDLHFVIEALSTGGQVSSAQANGSQYRTRGTVECLVECLGLQVHEVYAQTWKRFYGLTGKKADGVNQAALARELATKLYPSLGLELRRACDHNRAEAILVGHFFRKCRL
jgi:hypothetical protein